MFRSFHLHSLQRLGTMVLGALCLAVIGNGQTPPSAPGVAKRVSANLSNAPQQSTEVVPTIRTYSNIVVIDVVVTDSQGNAVHGLKKSDFTLMENNKEQFLRSFEEHTASSQVELTSAPKLPPGLFTNRSPVPANGPVNVLLLDYLNTPLTAQPYARKQLIDYLDHAPAGTRIAIFGLTTQLSMLQGFTSDMSALKAALASRRGAAQASQLLDDPYNGGAIGNTTLSNALSNDSGGGADLAITPEIVDSINRFETMRNSDIQDYRAKYTLNAFDLLARYLVGIPGRKNVIWFSGGFPLNIEPNVTEADPNDSVVRNDDEVRKTDNLLTRAQVAVYPVDARGLQTNPADNFASGSQGLTGEAAANSQNNFLTQLAQEHETMFAMAEDTGGQAFVNTNGLTQAVSKAIENGSNYYTVTYSPTNTQWDERFRSVKVKVAHPGVKLAYRNGYYAVDPNDRSKLVAGISAMAASQPTTMASAMMHGGPDPTEILFKVRIRPAGTTPEDAPVKTNQTNPDPNVHVEGPFRQYGIDLVPDPKSVNCRADVNGNRHCAIEVWTFVYNANGEKLLTQSNRLHTSMKPDEYARMMGTPEKPGAGIAFHQQISVPVKGRYYLRTAIHDLVSDRVGAVEIPVASVARLEPLKPLTPAATPPYEGAAPGPTAPVAPTPLVPAPIAPATPPR